MKNYLRWALQQLYLQYFCPTRLLRRTQTDESIPPALRGYGIVRFLVRNLPGFAMIIILGTLIAGVACELLRVPFEWKDLWQLVAGGVVVGVGGGVVIASAVNSVFGAAANSDVGGSDGEPRAVSSYVRTGISLGMPAGAVFALVLGISAGPDKAEAVVAAAAAGGVLLGVIYNGPVSVWGAVRFGGSLGLIFAGSLGAALALPLKSSRLALTISESYAAAGVLSATFLLTHFRLITYPVDVILSSITYIKGRRPGAAVRAWRWCPVAWNELIWLPLPFVSELLVLTVKQDREEGFKRIAFVAAERSLQRRAAVAALAEVAVDDLRVRSVAHMADVTDRLRWTTDAPAELAEEVVTTLPRFDRVAQHVGQYLTLNSSYRKREALARAVEEAGSLQRSLVAARGSNAPRLLQVANEWRRLLDEESEKVKSLPEAAREIPNPFVYGNAVVETKHNVFTGRRDVVREIEASLLGAAQAPTLLLQGPRRMGKTSILNQLPRLLGPDFAPAVVDCQNPAVTGSEATLLRYLSRALSEGLRRRRVSVEGLNAQQLAREPYAAFDEWLEMVERAMPKRMRALLCLDEYERLQAALETGWGAQFLDALRHTFQHRPRVVLMFTGAHTFQELGPAWTDRFISARRMRVSFLRREDVELLLTKPIPEFDMTYAAGALDALVAVAGCHPFLTQAVAFELVQLLNEGQRREATAADVEEAVGRALVSGDAYFVNVWGDAGAEGQAILRALAAGATPPELPAARAWLREHDVIGAEGDFAVEMMRRWVVARASLTS